MPRTQGVLQTQPAGRVWDKPTGVLPRALWAQSKHTKGDSSGAWLTEGRSLPAPHPGVITWAAPVSHPLAWECMRSLPLGRGFQDPRSMKLGVDSGWHVPSSVAPFSLAVHVGRAGVSGAQAGAMLAGGIAVRKRVHGHRPLGRSRA